MPESVTLNEELGIIEVHSFNTISTEDISSSVNLVQHISNETGIKKVLVDTLEQEAMPSITSILNLARAFPRNVKIAVLCSKEQTTFKDILFTENAALYQGISIRHFTSKTDAFQWLKR
jgi:hypothetical protein